MFTDGSSLGNPGPGGWSWWHHDGSWAAGALPHTTNQQAELVALLMALKHVPASYPLRVMSDSQYAVNMASKWMAAWKRAGWRTSSGQPVANLSIVKHLDAAIGGRAVRPEFVWVRGHAGVEGNERADRAAVAAAHAGRSGRDVASGPGWGGLQSARPGLIGDRPGSRPTGSASVAGPRQGGRRTQAPGIGASARGSRDRGKSPGTVRADGALGGARPEAGLAVMKCSSCGMTLHPLSLECRCTR